MQRIFLTGLAVLLALASGCVSTSDRTDRESPSQNVLQQLPTAYLFAHFTGESPIGEQIYFAVSEDGLRWADLNNSAPVLLSNLGEKGVRDPSLIRSPDGRKFYLLATDLRIASGKGWDAARFRGSTSLIFWESSDLVNWSEPWSVDVAGAIPGAGCAWAPEAIYDETAGDYFVYWATISPLNGVTEARIYSARTRDFRTFTPPKLYIERAGEGVHGGDIIDTQILRVDGAKYRYYRSSRDTQITIEGADSLEGAWARIGDLSYLGYTARQVEGPILFPFNEGRKWGLLADRYAAGRGYLPFVTESLEDPRGFQVVPESSFSLGSSLKRHGSILSITRQEYESLRARWPSVPAMRLSPVSDPERVIRHFNFALRLDAGDVRPAEDARWRLVPGLAGGEGTVSFRSVNFPDRYLTLGDAGVTLGVPDGSPGSAARATFKRVPGLADPSAVSFCSLDSDPLYLTVQHDALAARNVSTEDERRGATFLLRE